MACQHQGLMEHLQDQEQKLQADSAQAEFCFKGKIHMQAHNPQGLITGLVEKVTNTTEGILKTRSTIAKGT